MKEKILECVELNPGIKAKEIAKITGIDKKEINKLLHTIDNVEQDSKSYGWKLLSDDAITITFPNQWVESSKFERTLDNSEYLDVSSKDLVFEFQSETKLMMDATARFVSLVNQILESGRKVTIDLSNCPESRSYLSRAGFYDVLHDEVNLKPKPTKIHRSQTHRGKARSLVEFRKLTPAIRVDEVPNLLYQNLIDHLGISGSHYDPVRSFLFEIYNNVYDHVFDLKHSKLHAFAACQTYRRGDGTVRTQIVISDCGKGICKTLRPALKKNPAISKYSKLTDVDLVVRAFSRGELTRHDPVKDPNHGIGLYMGALKAKDMGASILIRQEDFAIELKWENDVLKLIRRKEDLKPLPGTNICFDFVFEVE